MQRWEVCNVTGPLWRGAWAPEIHDNAAADDYRRGASGPRIPSAPEGGARLHLALSPLGKVKGMPAVLGEGLHGVLIASAGMAHPAKGPCIVVRLVTVQEAFISCNRLCGQ